MNNPLYDREDMNLAPFKDLLLDTCGFSFEDQRERTLVSGLCRRMASRDVASSPDYLDLLNRDPEEMHRLVELLTINETYFFREIDQLRLVAERLIPEIMAEKQRPPIQVLSAGCSTGEEPYSVAMLLWDIHGPASGQWFSISGVDIDASVIAEAQKGTYGKGSFRNVEPNLVLRHFEPWGQAQYRLKEPVRNLVTFRTANLLTGPFQALMGPWDIILYRNVSIYFPSHIQKDIFSRLAQGLNPGGYLIVGATETIPHNIGILSLVERDSLFVYRKNGETKVRAAPQTGPGRLKPRVMVPAQAGKRPDLARSRKKAGGPSVQTVDARPDRFPAKAPTSLSSGWNSDSFYEEILELVRNHRPEEALERLDTLIARDESFLKAHTLRGSLLINTWRFSEAQAALDKAVVRDPLCAHAYLMLGMIAHQTGDREEALNRFRKAVFLDPACWPAHFFLAEVVLAQGGGKRAWGGFQTVVHILEKGGFEEHERPFFPLALNAEQCLVVSRHKLTVMKNNGWDHGL